MATRKRRARNTDGSFKADNPATPDVNEAWEEVSAEKEEAPKAPVEEEKVAEEAPTVETPKAPVQKAKVSKAAPTAEAPAPETEAPVVVEAPEAAAPVDTTALADMLADKRKDPEATSQPKDEGLKPMTDERLAEIRASAITPASVEKAGVDEIIAAAGVEKTRGREIAARLMYNARKNGGFV